MGNLFAFCESPDDRHDPDPSGSLLNCLSQLDFFHDVSDLDLSVPCSPEKQLHEQDRQSDASQFDMQAHPSMYFIINRRKYWHYSMNWFQDRHAFSNSMHVFRFAIRQAGRAVWCFSTWNARPPIHIHYHLPSKILTWFDELISGSTHIPQQHAHFHIRCLFYMSLL